MRRHSKLGVVAVVLATWSTGAGAAQPGIWGSVGANGNGQLGIGSTTSQSSLTAIVSSGTPPTLSGKAILQMGAADDQACAVDQDSRLFCWGHNDLGQVGTGSTTPANVTSPTLINGGALSGKTVRQVRPGFESTCAVLTDGTAACWGKGNHYQLGNLSSNDSATPVQVITAASTPLTGVTSISIAENYACAVAGGKVYCWGANDSGQLGKGTAGGADVQVPTQISTGCTNSAANGATYTDVKTSKTGSGGGSNTGTTCALTTTGQVHCWGDNNRSQIGDGGTTDKSCPFNVSTSGSPGTGASDSNALNGKTATGIFLPAAENAGVTCAVLSNGQAVCWGYQANGRVGNGVTSTTSATRPVNVSNPSGATSAPNFNKLSIGSDHVCGVTNQGTAYCWGGNQGGEFGNGNTTSSNIPVVAGRGGSPTPLFPSTYAFTDVVTGTDYSIFGSNNGGGGQSFKSSTWQMFSLPCKTAATTVDGILGSATNTPASFDSTCYGDNSGGCAGKGWSLYKFVRSDTGATGTYSLMAKTDTVDLTTNLAYWLKSYASTKSFRLFVACDASLTKPQPTFTDGSATYCASTAGCFDIPIVTNYAGNTYNLVTNPLPFAVDWSKVRICVGGSGNTCTTTYSPCQAAGIATGATCTGPAVSSAPTPLVSNQISIYNGNAYNEYSDQTGSLGNLGYFQSFWVNVLPGGQGQTLRLLIPAAPTTLPTLPLGAPSVGGAKTVKVSASAPGGKNYTEPASNWTLKLRVTDSARDMSHDNTTIGRIAGALDGNDPMDLSRTPPFSSPYHYLAVTHSDWGTKSGEYATDFRQPRQQSVAEWPFVIKTDTAGSTVRLQWEASSAKVLNSCKLIDVASGRSYSPGSSQYAGPGLDVLMNATTKTFIWRCNLI